MRESARKESLLTLGSGWWLSALLTAALLHTGGALLLFWTPAMPPKARPLPRAAVGWRSPWARPPMPASMDQSSLELVVPVQFFLR